MYDERYKQKEDLLGSSAFRSEGKIEFYETTYWTTTVVEYTYVCTRNTYIIENIVLKVRNVISPLERRFDEKYHVNEGKYQVSWEKASHLFIRADLLLRPT